MPQYFDEARQKHGGKMQQPLKIVYDFDDVLWGLNIFACQKLNIPLEKDIEFSIFDNPLTTAEEKEALLRTFNDPETFRHIQFFNEMQDILKVEELGAIVYVNSNCYTPEIRDLKYQQLREALPQLNPEHIRLNLINGSANHKNTDDGIFIFVDDSPYNIAGSTAKINIFPKYPWNTTVKAKQQVKNRNVIWKDSLQEINQYVYDTVKNTLNQPA